MWKSYSLGAFNKHIGVTEQNLNVLREKLLQTRQTFVSLLIKDTETRLENENIELKKKVNDLKRLLIEAEVKNGHGHKEINIPPIKPQQVLKCKEKIEVKKTKVPPTKAKTGILQDSEPTVARLDFRVGKIVDVKRHPDADSLYLEQIDVGEENPRTVVTGVVKHIPINEMENRSVVVLCNLKPAKMRGILSQAMVMCANTPEKLEIIDPPKNACPGDKVTFEGFNGTPDSILNPKKKVFEKIQPHLQTNEDCVACYKGVPFTVEGKGVCKVQTMKVAAIK